MQATTEVKKIDVDIGEEVEDVEKDESLLTL